MDDRLCFVAQFSICHPWCLSVHNTEPEPMAAEQSTVHRSLVGVSSQHAVWMDTIKGARWPCFFLFFFCLITHLKCLAQSHAQVNHLKE